VLIVLSVITLLAAHRKPTAGEEAKAFASNIHVYYLDGLAQALSASFDLAHPTNLVAQPSRIHLLASPYCVTSQQR
jgi:hypothetical protein